MTFRQFFGQLCLAMTMLCGSGVNAETFGQNDLMLSYGLYPASQFLISDGRCADCGVLPQAGWYFRGETIAGVGITRLTDVIVGDAIRHGELVPILTDWHHVEPVPLYATYPSGRNLSPKIRAMVEFLIDQFGSAPWRRVAERASKRAAKVSG